MGEQDNILNNDRAIRFISCYNQIDNALKMQEDHHKSLSYTEAVRKAARTNSLVRKYEESETEKNTNRRHLTDEELFKEFYKSVRGVEPASDLTELFIMCKGEEDEAN